MIIEQMLEEQSNNLRARGMVPVESGINPRDYRNEVFDPLHAGGQFYVEGFPWDLFAEEKEGEPLIGQVWFGTACQVMVYIDPFLNRFNSGMAMMDGELRSYIKGLLVSHDIDADHVKPNSATYVSARHDRVEKYEDSLNEDMYNLTSLPGKEGRELIVGKQRFFQVRTYTFVLGSPLPLRIARGRIAPYRRLYEFHGPFISFHPASTKANNSLTVDRKGYIE